MKKVILVLVFGLCIGSGYASGKKEASALSSEYFEIGNAYAELSKYDKAIEFYEKAKRDEKFSHAARYNMARMYGLKNEWAKAASLLKELNQEEPENSLILQGYGYALASAGQTKQAIEIYSKLAQKEPENPVAQLNYIRLLIYAKNYELATTEITKGIQAFPTAEERKQFETLLKQIEAETLDPLESMASPAASP